MTAVVSAAFAITISLLAAALVLVGRASVDDSFDALVAAVREFVASISVAVRRDDENTATITLRFHDPLSKAVPPEPRSGRWWVVVVEPTAEIVAPPPAVVPVGGTSTPLELRLAVDTPHAASVRLTVFDLASMEPVGAVRTAAPAFGSPERRSIMSVALRPVRVVISSFMKAVGR